MFVEYVALKPNFRIEHGADAQGTASQSTLVNEHFEFDALEIEVNPKQFATGKWILQRFEGYDAP